MRALGYDVLIAYDAQQANKGIPDDEVLRYATQSDRCEMTFNLDFVSPHSVLPHSVLPHSVLLHSVLLHGAKALRSLLCL